MYIASEEELEKKNIDFTHMHINPSLCPFLCLEMITAIKNCL